jgi:hypothetical protein
VIAQPWWLVEFSISKGTSRDEELFNDLFSPYQKCMGGNRYRYLMASDKKSCNDIDE